MACKVVPGRDPESIVSISVLKMESVFHLPDLYGAFFFFFPKLFRRAGS